MKKLFIVSELFYPSKTSTAYIMTELAEYLSHFYQVTVLTTDIKYDGNFVNEYKEVKYQIRKKKSRTINKNSFVSRIKGAFWNSYVLSKDLFKLVQKKDKVLAVTNPFLMIFFLALIRRVRAFEYTLLVHDVFPENTIPAGINNKNNPSYKLLKFVFDWSYTQADKLIVLGNDMKSKLVSKGINETKIVVIPNWFDDDVSVIDVDREKYLEISNLQDKIVIGFAGNVGRVQGLNHFIECLIKVDNDKLVFVVIGDGAMLSELKNLTKDTNNIYFLGNKLREEQSLFLNCFDISLVTLAPGMFGLGVPSKSYNILRVGKPILYIGDKQSEIDQMIDKLDCGWSFDWNQSDEIVAFLKNINKEDCNKYKSKNTFLATSMFSSEIIKKEYHKLLNQ
jgi:glycosyltransferase involved in cell wall biosynthesis